MAQVAATYEGQRVVGTVKSWKDQFGFLTSPEVQGDIFVHAHENPELGGPLYVGEQVIFDLTSGKNGQPHAKNVARTGATGGQAIPSMTGVLVSFRDGWGLIESPSLPEKLYCGERENPLLKEQGVSTGDEVQFEVGTNMSNGKSRAANMRLVVKEQSELVGRRCNGIVKTWKDGWGFASSSKFSGMIMLGQKHLQAAGLSWQLQVGATVSFEVSHGKQGKYEAVNIASTMPAASSFQPPPPSTPFPGYNATFVPRTVAHVVPPTSGAFYGGAAPGYGSSFGGARDRSRTPAARGSGRMTGTVKTFRGSWGFIQSDHQPGDIYVHAGAADRPLQAGERVEFDMDAKPGNHNGARARNVTSLGGGPVGVGGVEVGLGGGFGGGAGAGGGKGMGKGMGKGVAFSSAPPGQKVSGKMVSVKDTWGFATTASIQGDVFLGMRDNPHLAALPSVGDELSFQLSLDPKSGRYKALSVAPSLKGKRVQGTVMKVRDGGWGFASSEGVEGEVMLGKRNLSASGIEKIHEGDMLEFELNVAAKGYEAININVVWAH